jgi:hypothetical protein
VHTARRPEGARAGLVGYGPNLQVFAVYLMVVVRREAARCRVEVRCLDHWAVAAA